MPRQDIHFAEANTAQALIQCQGIRAIVFWEGQQIPFAIDQDGLDEQAQHILVTMNDEPAATARLRRVDNVYKVERVAVRPCFRGHGLGHRLMEYIDEFARERKIFELRLNAQAYLEMFYKQHGYTVKGAPFIEAGIEHLSMNKVLSAN